MRILSKAFGEIEIQEIQIIEFPEGILGFPDYHKYALLDSGGDPAKPGADSPFKWLQSLEEQDLAFITMEPGSFLAEYHPICSDEELRKIGVQNINDALILTIVTIPRDPKKMSANLQGPLIINIKSRQAIQAISQDDNHKVRYPIVEMMESRESGLRRAK